MNLAVLWSMTLPFRDALHWLVVFFIRSRSALECPILLTLNLPSSKPGTCLLEKQLRLKFQLNGRRRTQLLTALWHLCFKNVQKKIFPPLAQLFGGFWNLLRKLRIKLFLRGRDAISVLVPAVVIHLLPNENAVTWQITEGNIGALRLSESFNWKKFSCTLVRHRRLKLNKFPWKAFFPFPSLTFKSICFSKKPFEPIIYVLVFITCVFSAEAVILAYKTQNSAF